MLSKLIGRVSLTTSVKSISRAVSQDRGQEWAVPQKFIWEEQNAAEKGYIYTDPTRNQVDSNLLSNIQSFFMAAGESSDLTPDLLERIREPDQSLKVTVPLTRDDGTVEVITGYRCKHKNYYTPTKGGLRLSQHVTLQEVEAMGLLNTIKTAVADIPFGGAKGGLRMKKKDYSDAEIRRALEQYVIACKKHGFIGASTSIWGMDAGTSQKEMDVIANTYSRMYGFTDMEANGCVSGKSHWNYGVKGGIEAAGRSVFYVIRHILNPKSGAASMRKKAHVLRGVEDQKVIIQGYGTVGYWTAYYLWKHGAKVTAIVLDDCSIYNEDGLHPEEVLLALQKLRANQDWTDLTKLGELYLDNRALYTKCDFLVPCGLEMSITTENVNKLNAKMIVEAANGAISYKANEILQDKGVVVVPDVVAGLGGLFAAYFEFLTNIDKRNQSELMKKWEEKSKDSLLKELDGVFEKAGVDVHLMEGIGAEYLKGPGEEDLLFGFLEDGMISSLERTIKTAEEKNVDLRTAAYLNAFKRISSMYDKWIVTI